VRRHLAAVGLATALDQIDHPAPFAVDALLGHMGKDKKVKGGRLTFILARAIGEAFVTRDVDPTALRAFLAAEPGVASPVPAR
jgi:3-dehydroquinate synthase